MIDRRAERWEMDVVMGRGEARVYGVNGVILRLTKRRRWFDAIIDRAISSFRIQIDCAS